MWVLCRVLHLIYILLAVGYHRHALDGARAKRQPALLLDITPLKCKGVAADLISDTT